MSSIELIIVVPLVLFTIGFAASCHWWFRAFPDVPVMELFSYSPPFRSPYLGAPDFGDYITVSSSAVSFPPPRWACPSGVNG